MLCSSYSDNRSMGWTFSARRQFGLLGHTVCATLLSVAFTFVYASVSLAVTTSGITYQGRILKPDGTSLDDANVQFKMQIRSPDTNNCLIYEEVQSLDMRNSNGLFGLTMNDGNGAVTPILIQDGVAAAAQLPIERVFSNRGTLTFPAGKCAAGTTYAPNSSDARRLVVYFKDSTMAAWEQMPTQMINYVPYAFQAKEVQGFGINSLVRVQEADGTMDAVSPLSTANYTELLALIGGTSTQYEKLNQVRGVTVPAMGNNQYLQWSGGAWVSADPVAGVQQFAKTALPTCSAGDFLKDNGSGGLVCATPVGGGGGVTSVATGVGLTGGPITASGTIALAAVGSGGTGFKVTYDIYGRVTGAIALVEADIPTLVTAGKVSGNAIASGTIGGSTAINTTGAITTTALISTTSNINANTANVTNVVASGTVSAVTVSGRTVQLFNPTGTANKITMTADPALSSDYTLTWPLTAGSGGQVLTTNGTGTLTWTTIGGGSGITTLTGDVSATGSGSVAATIQPGAVTSSKIAVGGVASSNLAAGAVTYAKIQNVSSQSLLGNPTGVSGSVQEISIGSGLSLSASGQLSATLAGVSGSATLNNGKIWIGDGTNKAQEKTLVGDVTISNTGSATVAFVGGSIASAVNAATILANAATALNTNNALVLRDGTGNFAANVATLNGISLNNAGSIVTLTNPIGANYSMSLPTNLGSNGQVLTTNGAGITTWTTAVTSSTGFVQGGNTFAASAVLGTNDNNALQFRTNGANQVTISPTGYVGIGTTSPTSRLTIFNASAANVFSVNDSLAYNTLNTSGGSYSGLGFYTQSAQGIKWDNGLTAITGNGTSGGGSNYLSFYTNLINRMNIDASGNVGIGTTSATARLSVNGSMSLANGSGNVGFIASSTAGTANYTWPTAVSGGNFLQTDASGNLSWAAVGGGGDFFKNGSVAMTGALVHQPGTAAAPGMTFVGNTNTGVFQPASNTIGFAINGVEKIRISASGNVGIGTSNPTFGLEVATNISAGTNIYAQSNIVAPFFFGSSGSSGNVYLDSTTSAVKGNVFIAPNGGSVGVATISPTARLSVNGSMSLANGSGTVGFIASSSAGTANYTWPTAVSGGNFLQTDASGNLSWASVGGGGDFFKNGSVAMTGPLQGAPGTAALPGYTFAGATTYGMFQPASNAIAWSIAGAEKMRLDGSGNLGIGATLPSWAGPGGLAVAGTTVVSGSSYISGGNLIFNGGNGQGIVWGGSAPQIVNDSVTGLNLVMKIGSTEYMRLTSSGNFGIGTATPSARLSVNGSMSLANGSGSVGFIASSTAGTANYTWPTSVAGGNFLQTDGSGNLSWAAIGGGGDFFKNGSVAMTGALVVQPGTAAAPGLAFVGNTSTGLFQPASTTIGFSIAGSEKVRIDASGNVGIGTTSPSAGFDIQNGITASGGTAIGERLQQNLTAAANGDILTALYVNPTYTNGAFTGVKNYGLVVPSGKSSFGTATPEQYHQVTVSGNCNGSGCGLLVQNTNSSTLAGGAIDVVADNINYATEVGTTASGWTGGFGINGIPANTGYVETTAPNGLYLAANSPSSPMVFFTGGASSPVYERMRIATNGNVGIGTTTPSARLSINGSMSLSNGSGNVGFIASTASGTANYTWPTSVAGGNFLQTDGSGNLSWAAVGGGGDFFKNGSVAMTGAFVAQPGTAAAPGMTFFGNTNTGIFQPASSSVGVSVNGTEALRINSAGYIGLGTSTPTAKLDVNGSINIRGGNAITISTNDNNNGGTLAIGSGALQAGNLLASGDYENTAIGYLSMSGSMTTAAIYNTAVGYSSLNALTSGRYNTALGNSALLSNTSGQRNTAVGLGAAQYITTGSVNTAVGAQALSGVTNGNYNVAVGPGSLASTNGSGNVAIGVYSGFSNLSGNNNTLLGYYAGFNNLTLGSNDILIGANTDVPVGNTSNYINIGNLIFATSASGSIASPLGFVGIGTTTPTAKLSVNGSMSLANGSGNVGFIASSTAGTANYTWPTSVAGGNFLQTDGSGNLSWAAVGGGDFFKNGSVAMTGPLVHQPGTAAAPGMTFVGDTSTGIFQPASSTIGLSVAGSEKLRVNASGWVGIGTTSPTAVINEKVTWTDNSAVKPVNFIDVSIAPPGSSANWTYAFQVNSTIPSSVSTTTSVQGIVAQAINNASNPIAMALIGGQFNAQNNRNIGWTPNIIGSTSNATNSGTGSIDRMAGAIVTSSSSNGTMIAHFGEEVQTLFNGGTAQQNVGIGLYPQLNAGTITGYIASGQQGFLATDIEPVMTGGTATDMAAVYVYPQFIAGTLTNKYGVYIDDDGHAPSGKYFGLYQARSTVPNYFAGNVGIGTTTTASKLSVNGSMSISNGSGTVGFIASSTAGTANYTWPTSVTSGNFLQTDGSGNLTWAAAGGGGGDFFKSGSVAMTGALVHQPGTAAAPGMTFVGDTSTGFFQPASSVVGLSVAGAEKLRVNASGFVGIGTNAPGAQLQVNVPANTPALSIYENGSQVLFMDQYNDMVLSGGGAFQAPTVLAGAGNAAFPGFRFNQAVNSPGLFSSPSTGLNFATNGTEQMRIDASGNVGVGTTSPPAKLAVNGSMVVMGSTSGYNGFVASAVAGSTVWTLPVNDGTSGQVLATNGSGQLVWQAAAVGDFLKNGSVAMTGSLLLTSGTASAPAMAFSSNTSTGLFQTASSNLGFAVSGAEKMRIDASGNVGIGVTPSSNTKLYVNGQIASSSKTITTAAIDFSFGNAVSTSYDCPGALTLANVRDGGTYTIVVTGAGTAQCVFPASTTGDDAAAVTYKWQTLNGLRTANSHTMYTLVRVGTVIYVSWATGFQ